MISLASASLFWLMEATFGRTPTRPETDFGEEKCT